jgi:hypothetical protein
MEEKYPKTEVAEQQPAEQAKQPENTVNSEAMMQMMKHLWPDTNEQRDKEYWRNLHKELLFHYESEFGKESNIEDAFSKALIYARFAMNEIQSYERNGFQMQTKEAKEAEHGE